MSNSDVPRFFNGKSTEYRLFDGFAQTSTLGKVVWVITFPVGSAIFEGLAAGRANETARDAFSYIQSQQQAMQTQSQRQPAYASSLDMNPGAQQETRFQEALMSEAAQPTPGAQR